MPRRDDLQTKTQLLAQRLKPAPGQLPAHRYYGARGWVNQYDPALAVPLRAYRAPSQSQSEALARGRVIAATDECYMCGARVDREIRRSHRGRHICEDCARRMLADEARELINIDPLFLDTETTGLDYDDEIIELAVLDTSGKELINTLIRPIKEISWGAFEANGISESMLIDKPALVSISNEVNDILSGRVIVAHNASFDSRMLRQTFDRYGISEPENMQFRCTMSLISLLSDNRYTSLGETMWWARAKWPERDDTNRSHRAAYDAECVRRIVMALAECK